MKRVTTVLSLLGLSVFLSCKQRLSLPISEDGKSLLWEVSGKRLKQPSYFLGTMHLMCAEDAVLSAATEKVMKQVDTIYLEVDLDNAGELLSGILDLNINARQQLHEVLSDSEYTRVKDFFERYQPNLPFSVLEKQYPLLITSSLYELFLTCEKKNGVELLIVDKAYKLKKEVKGLETMEFQANIFNQIPYEDQAHELVKTIDNLSSYKKALDEMVREYKQQDVQKLYELTTKEESGTAGYTDILLKDRNLNWVKQFDSIASKNSTLFAVGAGHLGGDIGVLNLLRQKGYTVKPLYNR
jgi:uncharacterized protein YbaP (TraB family)